jgi:hypothetical protein
MPPQAKESRFEQPEEVSRAEYVQKRRRIFLGNYANGKIARKIVI